MKWFVKYSIVNLLCQICYEPMDDSMCYDCEWFFKKPAEVRNLLCPQCRQPFSENKICEDCGFFIEEQEFIVNDLYNYNARPQRAYHRLDSKGGKVKHFRPRFCTKSRMNYQKIMKQPQPTWRKLCGNLSWQNTWRTFILSSSPWPESNHLISSERLKIKSCGCLRW